MGGEDFRFLFRDAEGTIPAQVWRRWTIVLTLVCVALTAIWILIQPWTQRDLSTQGLFDLGAFLAFTYLLAYSLGLTLAQISQFNLSAKRFRACGMSAAWAAIWPLTAFAAAASFWIQPNLFGLLPEFAPWLFLGLAVAAFAAQFIELGRARP